MDLYQEKNPYKEDGVPGKLSDGSYWVQSGGTSYVGMIQTGGPEDGWNYCWERECLEIKQFGNNLYARWIERTV